MLWTPDKKTLVGFALLLALMAASGMVSAAAIRAFAKSNAVVAEALEHRSDFPLLMEHLRESESSARRYVLTAEESDFAEYEQHAAAARAQLAKMQAVHVAMASELRHLETLLDQRIVLLAELTALRRTQGLTPAQEVVKAGVGKALTREISERVWELDRRQMLLVQQHQAAATAQGRRALLFAGLSGMLGVGVVLIAFSVLRRDLRRRDALELARSRLTAVLEESTDFVGTADTAGRPHFLNRAFRNAVGMEAEAPLDSLRISAFHPPWAMQRIVENGIPTALEKGAWSGDTSVRAPDGSEIPVWQVILAHRDRRGAVEYLSTVMRDLRPLLAAQAALRASEERYRDLVENSQDFIITHDLEGRILSANAALLRFSGLTLEQVIGRNLRASLHPARVTEFDEYLSTVQREGAASGLMKVVLPTGETRLLEYRNSLRTEGLDRPIVRGLARDITETHELEKLKEQFVSIISHELRTPLTSIHGALGLLASGALARDPERAAQMLRIAAENAERLVRLIADVLDLERITHSGLELERAPCTAGDLMHASAESMQGFAAAASVTVAVEDGAELRLTADRDRIRQVLDNLVNNAIKFSPAGSSVTLHADAERSGIRFEVRDRGRGIPSHKLDAIFERFQQVDVSDARERSGTGLGLAICKAIVERHGGRIWAESVLGQGSSFFFTLPAGSA